MYEEKLISGKVISAEEKQKISQKVKQLKAEGIDPKLSVIIVGENPASQSYVKGKVKDCAECDIDSDTIALPESTTQQELLDIIEKLNNDETVHGILVQLPLPKHIEEYAVINAISSDKDVDGFTAVNVGNMHIGKDCFIPCTPQGCIDMLEYAGVEIEGKDVVVIGRSNIVGFPVASLLIKKSATVTICHSKTKNIAEKTRNADIVIIAIGCAGFLTADMIKEGAVIVDIGINRNSQGKLCGDVDFDSVAEKCSFITPVPGGVGPMTISMLMQNTLTAAKLQNNLD